MEVPVEERLNQVRNKMKVQSVDLLVLSPGPNMKYITGLEAESSGRHLLLLVPSLGDPMFFAPELVREEVKETGLDSKIWSDNQDVISEMEEFLNEFDSKKVLLDDKMWELFSRDVRRILEFEELGLASEVMDRVRAVKSDDEIRRIRKASEIGDKVVGDVRDKNIVGMTENELKDFIEEKMGEYGGEGPSFDTTVASGPNGSRPHHVCSERVIEPGDPVTVDFGCWYKRYPSDQTRTIAAGDKDPSDKFKEVFEIVRKAQQEGVEAVEPGIQDRKIDEVVRNVIEEAGYGEEFIHRTGHGVGIEIHESPKIPPKNHETSMKLKSGMVFSVEPGIYIEGEFGLRIEDLVVVTEDGCERLNRTDRSWK